MGALAGFIVGYIAGLNGGPQSLEELRKAWQTISGSEEFQGLVETATGFLQSFLAQGSESVAQQIASLTSGKSELFQFIDGSAGGGIGAAIHKMSESPEYQALFANGAAILGNVLSQASVLKERATRGH